MIGVRRLGGMASLVVAGLGLAVGLVGCGDRYAVGRTVSVVGKVTVDGKPVKAGTVSFRPDKSKGTPRTKTVRRSKVKGT